MKSDFDEIQDNEVSIDLEIRFHTIAKYLGLIGSKDVDFFSETRNSILVNEDKQEDLLSICKLFGLRESATVSAGISYR